MERYSSIDASNDQYQRSSAAWSASRENGTASRRAWPKASRNSLQRTTLLVHLLELLTTSFLSVGAFGEMLSHSRMRRQHCDLMR
jgi:hypothetical protein